MSTTLPIINQDKFPYFLPNLPYGIGDLEPHMSKTLMEYHYGKHHKTYVDKLNILVQNTDYEGLSLEEIMQRSISDKKQSIYNNAAQIWNHTFFWHCMSPKGGGRPEVVIKLIEKQYGSFDRFVELFKETALNLFGSGWVWLVFDGEELEIVPSSNASNPIISGKMPLLVVDVWEHAYYIDHYNQRKSYIDVFFDKLVNWKFVDQQVL